MKKQIPYIVVIFGFLVLTTSTLLLGIRNTSVLAAPARCFDGSGSEFRQLSSCPTTNGFRDTQGSIVTTPAQDKCYQGNFTPGPNITVYVEGDCTGLNAFAVQVREDLCTASGGSWINRPVDGGAFTVGSCTCPPDKPLSSQTRQCTTAPLTQEQIDAAENTIETVDGPTTDCDSGDGTGDLNGENCKIVGLLNTAFNLVSGGVALAVIGNIIVAGIQYSTAQGDPSAAGKAKNRIRGALIAFLMYLGLYAFLQWLIPGGVF